MAKTPRSQDGGGTGEAKKPVHTIRYNTGAGTVEATIWQNSAGEGDESRVVYNVTLKRSYQYGTGWKSTNSLRYQELPHAVECLMEAYRYIQNLNQKR